MNTRTARLPSLLEQLAAATGHASARPTYNPRPAGLIRPGSTTERALFALLDAGASWRTHAQLKRQLGCSKTALSWALIYLRSINLIERRGDPRQYRYRSIQVSSQE